MNLFLDLLRNVFYVICLCSLGMYIILFFPKKHSAAIWGILFGISTVIVLSDEIVINDGVLLDFRTVTMALAGFTGGPATVLISGFIGGSFRYIQGGAGTPTGVCGIFIFGLIGVLAQKVYPKLPAKYSEILVGFGIGCLTSFIAVFFISLSLIRASGNYRNIAGVLTFIFVLNLITALIVFKFHFFLNNYLHNTAILNAIINSSPVKLIAFTEKGPVLISRSLLNDEKLTDITAFPSVLIPGELKLNAGTSSQVRSYTYHIDKDSRYLAVQLAPLTLPHSENAYLGIISDITDLKQQETEMRRLARLDLIGQMAAGISHEVRNPMTTVRGFLQYMREKPPYQKDKDYFDVMIEEIDRANAIITEFLSIGKSKIDQFRILNLTDIIKSLTPLLEANALQKEINLKIDLQEIPKVRVERNEICQLILNLSQNAFEAMSPGGLLTIRTRPFKHNEVVLEIEDTGTGIAEKDQGKIGTPFFTTKKEGTGLGLAICESIITRHEADMSFRTSGHGTIFIIRFKAAAIQISA